MKFKLQKELIVPAIAVSAFSVFMAISATLVTVPLVYGTGEGFYFILKAALGIASIVPVITAFPIAYFVAIQRQNLRIANSQLRKLVRYDQLTGLLSRRTFFDEAAAVLAKPSNHRQPNAVMFIDLDHFKQINDRFGHGLGDDVLRIVGEVINEQIASGELAARMGGEEFAILIPNCSKEDATFRAERLISEFRRRADVVGGHRVQGSLSVGLTVSSEVTDLDALLNQADRRLYLAKQNGRNRVEVEEKFATAA